MVSVAPLCACRWAVAVVGVMVVAIENRRGCVDFV